MMEHFSEQVWADFVRGTSSAEGRGEMELHFAKGCIDCVATLNLWQQVREIAARENSYNPPETAQHMSKAAFSGSAFHQTQEITARLMFDTFSQPLLAGVRSFASAAARQMLYEADGLTVDLRFDSQAQPNKVHLIGQVLDRRVPRASLGDACVMLWTDRGLPVVETRTNNLGEFTMEFADVDNLRLSIQVGRTHIRIPLAKLTAKPHVGRAGTSNQ